jgi:hypothetical protein
VADATPPAATPPAGTPPARRRSLLWVLVAIGLVIAVAVVGLLVAVLVRQPASPTAAATPTPTPAVTTPSPGSGEPSPAPSQQQQHQEYRAYVSTLVQGGTAVIADIFGLAGCRDGRPECVKRLNDASNQVSSLQKDLAANPAPPCLSDADARLQDSLTFQQKGLDTARNAVLSQNRIRLMQGLLLTAVGLWRGGQAIADGRNANC